MINYAKHDEEFHAVFKLLSGDEVLGKTILTEDNGETLAFVQDPVCVEIFNKDIKDENKVMRGMAFNKWMQLAEEEFYIIREKDIIAVASMNKDVMIMYNAFITGTEVSEERRKQAEIAIKNQQGYIGNIEDARKLFEKIFKT
tara:strand:+ start:962 stop:1390 length:429 start_codon:yes stop_codon:yes gene_type:complete